MSRKFAYQCLTLAAILVVVVCTPAAADDDHHDEVFDCSLKFGPSCTECVNATKIDDRRRSLLSISNRRLRSSDDDHDDHSGTHINRTVLACATCDAAAGYVLKVEHDLISDTGVPVGECKCAAGWGIEYVPATNPKQDDGGIFTCVDCSLTTKVPLSKRSGIVVVWKTTTGWTLAQAGTRSDRRPSDAPRNPYYEGQCVTCPVGYAPNTAGSFARNTQCVKV